MRNSPLHLHCKERLLKNEESFFAYNHGMRGIELKNSNRLSPGNSCMAPTRHLLAQMRLGAQPERALA